MNEGMEKLLRELVSEYGVEILEDPDRLLQFMEYKDTSGGSADAFRFTFALHSVIRAGWTAAAPVTDDKRKIYVGKLERDLFYDEDEADALLNLLDSLTEHKNLSEESGEEEESSFVATPGNLRRIAGGIANNPRTMWLRKKSIYSGTVLFIAFLAIVLLFFQIGMQRMPEGNEFRIAFFAPLSHDASQHWHRQLKAAQLGVERLNRQGGIRGFKLRIIGYDIPDDPEKAAEKVENIMKDKSLLVMLTGISGSGAQRLAEVADRLEIPLILSSAEITDDTLVGEDGKPRLYAFRISSTPAETARLTAYFAVSGLKARKIALLHNEDNKYSVEARDSLRVWLRRYGRRVAADLGYSSSDTDYTLALKTIKASRADTLILPGNTKHIARLLAQAEAVGFKGKILGTNFCEDDGGEYEAYAENSWWLNRTAGSDPQILSLQKDYRQLYNEICPVQELEAAVLVYDSVLWTAAALYRAPGYRGEAVRHGLLSTRNLALTHATFTTDPRTHGPLDKACALIRSSGRKGIFQRRISLKTDL